MSAPSSTFWAQSLRSLGGRRKNSKTKGGKNQSHHPTEAPPIPSGIISHQLPTNSNSNAEILSPSVLSRAPLRDQSLYKKSEHSPENTRDILPIIDTSKNHNFVRSASRLSRRPSGPRQASWPKSATYKPVRSPRPLPPIPDQIGESLQIADASAFGKAARRVQWSTPNHPDESSVTPAASTSHYMGPRKDDAQHSPSEDFVSYGSIILKYNEPSISVQHSVVTSNESSTSRRSLDSVYSEFSDDSLTPEVSFWGRGAPQTKKTAINPHDSGVEFDAI
ncbi:hypothetical protein DFS34DRAFT_646495 [Phlyctochytrium arcticum]|nr:hypothetical protein DFS34DRAFT_646495 [Phlyctochytrium arcticum]